MTFWGELESDEESEGEDEGQDMDTDEESEGEAVSAPLAEGEAQKVLATLPGAHRTDLDLGGLVTPAGG